MRIENERGGVIGEEDQHGDQEDGEQIPNWVDAPAKQTAREVVQRGTSAGVSCDDQCRGERAETAEEVEEPGLVG